MHGYVDREAHGRVKARRPLADLRDRHARNLAAHATNQTLLFCSGDEIGGHQQAAHGVLPPRQRLNALPVPRFDVDNRLVTGKEFAAFHSEAQIVGDRELIARAVPLLAQSARRCLYRALLP